MKKILCSVFILFILFLCGCNKQNDDLEEIVSPDVAVLLMHLYSSANNEESFATLFRDGVDPAFIKEKYDLVDQIESESASSSVMTLVQYDRGQAVLVTLDYDPANDIYFISDITEVPEDVQNFFKKNVLSE